MPFIELTDSSYREIVPGFLAGIVHSEQMTVIHWKASKDAVLPEHSHIHEQIVNVIEGEFELDIAGESQLLSRGRVAVIPSGALHSGRALTECFIVDIFHPVREDYR